MVLCIVLGCGSKSGKHKVIFSKIPHYHNQVFEVCKALLIICKCKKRYRSTKHYYYYYYYQGVEWKEWTRKRRNRWILVVSRGDTEVKNVLGSERFRSRHFPFREAPSYLGQATLNLSEKACKETNGKRTEGCRRKG